MLARTSSFAVFGADAVPVHIEIDASEGRSQVILLGMAKQALSESVVRAERALVRFGYDLYAGQTFVNFVSPEIPLDRAHFDLPTALAMLIATVSFCLSK
jgi:magnesium chelatase family protein